MSKAKVVAGACGFTSVIRVIQQNRTQVAVQIFSACPALQRMTDDLKLIDWHSGVFARITDSVVYKSASKELVHADCPVPSAILKATAFTFFIFHISRRLNNNELENDFARKGFRSPPG